MGAAPPVSGVSGLWGDEMTERDFKGVWIPREVWLDDRLSALDKVILVEIDSLDMGDRGCYASNRHLADFAQCSEAKVSKAISKLTKLGYVYVQKFDGRTRELKSSLAKNTSLPSKKYEADSQKVRESNTGRDTGNKPKSKSSVCAELIQAFTEDRELQTTIWDFVEMRRQMKAPMTEKAMSLFLAKLGKLSRDTSTQMAIVNQSIENGWKSIYPLKDTEGGRKGKNGVKLLPESEEDHILDGIL